MNTLTNWLNKGSWKTTSTGLLAIAGGLVRLAFAIKNNAITEEAVMTTLTTVVTGVGLLVARDNDKSSEEIGVTPEDKIVKSWANGNGNGSGNPKVTKVNHSLLPILLALAMFSTFVTGCALFRPVDAGSDPLVVRTEQLLNTAKGTFQLTLQMDDLDRGFWRSKAPAFHEYCETLRRPTPYLVTNTLPQYRVALLSLNDLKRQYKLGAANSNTLYTALVTLAGVYTQAEAWLTIVTNRPNYNPN